MWYNENVSNKIQSVNSTEKVDVKENRLLKLDPELLNLLLIDRTRTTNKKSHYILWATEGYQELGAKYKSNKEITADLVTGEHGEVIKPRTAKTKEEQKARTKGKAEVFTPSHIVNDMNKLVEDNWKKSHKITSEWQDFVKLTELEITCGEAPFICSRYDATTSKPIALTRRVGFLDRKMQQINKHCDTEKEWLEWAKIAYQNSYGYEWQGDNILLARENLLYTFIDYYKATKWNTKKSEPNVELQEEIAEIISWNIWQMDGLKYTIPETKINAKIYDWEEDKPVEYKQIVDEAIEVSEQKRQAEEIKNDQDAIWNL
jgi:hypothetical protein